MPKAKRQPIKLDRFSKRKEVQNNRAPAKLLVLRDKGGITRQKKTRSLLRTGRKKADYSAVVEVRRIELLSENTSAKGTTSVVCD